MVAWKLLPEATVGCIGGYSGGGSFQLEKFVLKSGEFFIEFRNNLAGEFEQKLIEAAEDCQDLILSFHDEDLWLEADNLVLQDTHSKNLTQSDDVFTGGSKPPPEFILLFKEIGLISVPISGKE
jgi:hypothetical protein